MPAIDRILSLFFYGLQLFLAVAVRRPIPHTAHLGIVVQEALATLTRCDPPSRLLSWAISPSTHTLHYPYTTHYRPATVKAVYAILYSPEASLLQVVATHLTLNHGFPIIRLSQPGGCIDPTESLAERQRRSPRG